MKLVELVKDLDLVEKKNENKYGNWESEGIARYKEILTKQNVRCTIYMERNSFFYH